MKVLVVLVAVCLIACNTRSSEIKTDTKEQYSKPYVEDLDNVNGVEKLMILSSLNKIDVNILDSVIREYYVQFEDYDISSIGERNSAYLLKEYTDIVLNLSSKHSIKKEVLFSLIYQFKYSMKGSDELYQEFYEELQHELEEYHEYEEEMYDSYR